jgi:hypothetical protein
MTTIGEGAPNDDSRSGETDSPRKKQTTEQPHWIAYVEGACAILLVLITATYTYYAARQLHKLKRSTDAAVKAAEAAKSAADTAHDQMGIMKDTLALERPWLGPNGVITKSVGPEQPPSGQPIDWRKNTLVGMAAKIQNGGRNPGTNVRWHMVFKSGKPWNGAEETPNSGLPTDEICDKGELSSYYGSGTIMSGVVITLPVWVPKRMSIASESIFNRKMGLYVVGCLDYSDTTFKKWYRTNMRWVFVPIEPDPFVMTRFGNEAR